MASKPLIHCDTACPTLKVPDVREAAEFYRDKLGFIQRVDIQARVEKRLASLMADLAEHKGMTIGEVLEETLLHTFEPLAGSAGQGVASPHTRQTLAVIEELKRKHGIDYDTHASYRFMEQ